MTSLEAMKHKWLAPDSPASPQPITNNERKPVKQLLSEFNAQRKLANVSVSKSSTKSSVSPVMPLFEFNTRRKLADVRARSSLRLLSFFV